MASRLRHPAAPDAGEDPREIRSRIQPRLRSGVRALNNRFATSSYRRARPRVALDMLVYTPEELQPARVSSSFLRTALREAQVVYERSRSVA